MNTSDVAKSGKEKSKKIDDEATCEKPSEFKLKIRRQTN